GMRTAPVARRGAGCRAQGPSEPAPVAGDARGIDAVGGPQLADHLSEGTVRNKLSEVISKLGAANRVDAARIARDRGWL
ncbi:MAG: response regulator transcription factor, partial [Burkholderiaceae bacterium]